LQPVARDTSIVTRSASGHRAHPNRRMEPRLSHFRKG
jgi:hypothetical protein